MLEIVAEVARNSNDRGRSGCYLTLPMSSLGLFNVPQAHDSTVNVDIVMTGRLLSSEMFGGHHVMRPWIMVNSY